MFAYKHSGVNGRHSVTAGKTHSLPLDGSGHKNRPRHSIYYATGGAGRGEESGEGGEIWGGKE